MQTYQHTLKKSVSCTGVGLHSGKRINLKLRAAEPDTGIVFKRTDLPLSPFIPGDVYNVVDTSLCTTIGKDGVTVSTVEHLLSALAGLGVDNALIEVDGPEVPIMDGSSAPFIFIINNVGLTSQTKTRQFYVAQQEISITEGDKIVKIKPSDRLRIDFSIEFNHPAIRKQKITHVFTYKNYADEISRARTFGFLADMRKLYEAGLALGGSLENAVVLDDYNVLNKEGLRFKDEFVRHKILDFIGDLALVGHSIQAHFIVHKSGHDLNNRLFRKFLSDPQAWRLATAGQVSQSSTQKQFTVPAKAAVA